MDEERFSIRATATVTIEFGLYSQHKNHSLETLYDDLMKEAIERAEKMVETNLANQARLVAKPRLELLILNPQTR